MKYLALYSIPIRYMLMYTILILLSGLWLFLLSQGLANSEGVMDTLRNILTVPVEKSIHGLMEVVTPHLFCHNYTCLYCNTFHAV
ncbi:MAG: hypothetical protein Q9M39_01855 [Sulfurovum sp.]|nr:hypothetical protein [Sulfurovum sp.]